MTEVLDESQLTDAHSPGPEGAVVTVGTFDGVHRGHLAVLDAVRHAAAKCAARSTLVTFEPHPLTVVRPIAAPRLLTTAEEKARILGHSGLDLVAILHFTPALAEYSPRRFVEEILVGRFGLRHLVVGHDHGFGRGRSGDVDALRDIGSALGFDVEVVPAVLVDGAPISSSRIREALEVGDVRFAARGLGRPYGFHGVVVRGDGRGRALGFPTANLEIGDARKLAPDAGIYAVRANVEGESLDAVLHVGPRPTFPGTSPSIEVHLLDIERTLYGAEMRVDLCARLRGIETFDTTEALVRAIAADCAAARRLFATGGEACQDGGVTLV